MLEKKKRPVQNFFKKLITIVVSNSYIRVSPGGCTHSLEVSNPSIYLMKVFIIPCVYGLLLFCFVFLFALFHFVLLDFTMFRFSLKQENLLSQFVENSFLSEDVVVAMTNVSIAQH